ncbi:unnamed protein product [Acanthosepion pharaonis]|uniref:VWFA domain-containing protein n=1 Tax=Acanthosepion pharaonis TaxID=158019 RepID=A0A812DJ77_ACAPH|nr:unnamed protein product [Sepia pharaonis]
MTVIQAKPASTCLKKATDIIFVLDSSSSIWVEDYKKQLQFVADLVDSFKVENGISQVRVGAITFSDQAYLEFPLGHYSKPAQMKEAISKFIHRTGGTNTAKALQLVRSQLHIQTENRKGPVAVIVVTDGKSSDREATKAEAKKLHQLDINVYAIGVGDQSKYDINELKAIASNPIRGVYTVASYSALKEIAQTFYAQPCKVNTERERPQRDKESIVIFGYDLITMGSLRVRMISQFINLLLPYTVYEYFSVISYAYCPEYVNIPVISLKNKTFNELQNSVTVNANIPGLAEVVRQMRSEMYRRTLQYVQSGHVLNRVAVLFVDPSVTVITKELIEETGRLKQQGVKLFIINVGQAVWPHPQYLHFISSQPHSIRIAPTKNQMAATCVCRSPVAYGPTRVFQNDFDDVISLAKRSGEQAIIRTSTYIS